MGFIDPSLLERDDTDNVTCSICMQLLQERGKMMQPDGTIRFMGRYWFRDPWRQSHLEGDDWDD